MKNIIIVLLLITIGYFGYQYYLTQNTDLRHKPITIQHEKILNQFAESFIKNDYQQMYQLMADAYKIKINFEDFQKKMMDERKKYGEPLKYQYEIDEGEELFHVFHQSELYYTDEEIKQDYGIEVRLPDEEMLKITSFYFDLGLSLDSEANIDSCYSCEVYFYPENDQIKLIGYEFSWCD